MTGPRRQPVAPRFWSQVEKTDDCWLWTGSGRGNGYGGIGVTDDQRGTHSEAAHRVSWQLHFGPIPEGLEVCHHCDVRRCVRPDHLFLGTRSDNMQDAARKGRLSEPHGSTKTHCPLGHAYDDENTMFTRRGHRKCRACHRLLQAAAYVPRERARPSHCKRGHEYTPENTYTYPSGDRRCRACRVIEVELRRQKAAS